MTRYLGALPGLEQDEVGSAGGGRNDGRGRKPAEVLLNLGSNCGYILSWETRGLGVERVDPAAGGDYNRARPFRLGDFMGWHRGISQSGASGSLYCKKHAHRSLFRKIAGRARAHDKTL